MKNGRILLLEFSTSTDQKEAHENKNSGIGYYDTQKKNLLDYLAFRFPNHPIVILNVNLLPSLNIGSFGKNKLIRSPYIFSPNISAVIFNITSSIYILKNIRNINLVFVYSASECHPYIFPIFCAKVFRIPLFMSIRNPPMSICSFDRLSSWRKCLYSILDGIYLKHSSKIIHTSKMSKELLKCYPEYYDKSIILAASSSEIFCKEITRKESLSKNLNFAYWGVVTPERDLGVVLKGFKKAQEADPHFDSKLYICGDGPDLENLMQLANISKIKNVIFKGYLIQEDLCAILQERPVAVIPIPPREIFKYSTPIKLAEAITMELPILASNIEPNGVVRYKTLGILCDHNIEDYSKAFLQFQSFSEDELNQFSENCRKIKFLYSYQYLAKDVGDAIESEIIKNDD
jgi:glycosyltransferase involved in cell wall biosynthesis